MRIHIFSIAIEFDKELVKQKIVDHIQQKEKGYICAVDTNIVSIANKNPAYLSVVNNSILNICDGGTIAFFGRKIYNQKLERYTGPDLFLDFISRGYSQAFLGNTPENLDILKDKMQLNRFDLNSCLYYPLPFKTVDEFDYKEIANKINQKNIDIVWISLGAPKQEIFASKLLPYINDAILIAVGAAFNFYIGMGNYHRAPQWMQKMNIEWIYRLFLEPKKQMNRIKYILKVYPRLIVQEYKKNR
ncbi:MAG: WecB/TagA/CpsF family glycosyltransferase [Bacteroides cellulosilyticus]|jgi:N-acetylglucosaminyldiphosphoundecaprenol N-acetyl-beta-D-mannosaminyltransferase|uniref:WecB/TagA/CpsF family glycosyltransferase n=1 Tax=Bacteroides cellulosilyticus TaxID=246787 RepID=UPI003042EDBA